MRLGGNVASALHDVDFRYALEQTQIMQRMFQRHKLARWLCAAAHLAANDVDPLGDAGIELRIKAERVKHALGAFDQAGQDVVDIANRKGIIDTVQRRDALRPGDETVPQFLGRIALPAKQDALAVFASGYDD